MRAPASVPLAALAAALLLPAAAHAQDAERFVLRGDAPEVSHVVGRLRVVAGSGSDVAVEVTRRGRAADRTAVERRTVEGREALRIYPRESRVSYPGLGSNEVVQSELRDDGTFEGGWRGGWRGMRVSRRGAQALEIRGDGRGVETWADVTVSVPAGRRVVLRMLAGEATVRDVDGDLLLDVETASTSVQGTRGRLRVDAGSGEVRLTDVRGDLDLDLGSGTVEVSRLRAGTLRVDGGGSGGVRGGDVEATSIDLDLGSGDTRLDGVRAARIRVDGGSGNVDLGLAAGVEDLHVDTGSGSVTLRVPESFGATFDVDAGSGGFESELPATYTRRERGRIAGRIGDGRARVEIDTGSGGVSIRRAR